MDCNLEDSLDGGGPPSVGSGEMPSAPNTPITNTPVAKKKNKTKLVTGYILYSREVRKSVCQNNPESTFGEVSKIVGNDWRGLPIGIKQSWEERAIRMNDDTKAALLLQEEQCNSPSQTALPAPPPDQIFECLWDNCDYQFEEVSDLVDHCVRASSGSESSGTGHVYSYFASNQDVELNCYWRGCMRQNKKNALPFPNMARLTRHVRDMHINKGNGRSVLPESRSKNFKVSSKLQSAARPTPTSTVVTTSTSNNYNTPVGILATTPATTITTKIVPTTTAAPSQVKPQEPMFITVPPRPQRALHSEAYIKYIEGLHAENKFISPWERTLTVTPAQVPVPDPEKLQSVAAWLGPKADQHENVLNALWTLRNQLLRDSLCLQKTL